MNTLILIQALSCWFMTGLIWSVQSLIYPNFLLIGESEFESFHQFHLKRITYIVAPAMGIELVSGIWLLWIRPDLIFSLNLVSILMLWALTALVNVPSHENLNSKLKQSKKSLIHKNWPRSIIWSLRSIFWFYMLSQIISGSLK